MQKANLLLYYLSEEEFNNPFYFNNIDATNYAEAKYALMQYILPIKPPEKLSTNFH